MLNELDHTEISSMDDISTLLKKHGCEKALLKKLAKNNNDKNQVYFHHDASLLNSVFDLEFSTRVKSKSKKDSGMHSGKRIQEAKFKKFSWISVHGRAHGVAHCKGILYHQYPEVRLSGFKADDGQMPSSMSVDFTRAFPDQTRYLVIGANPEGAAFAIMVVSPLEKFEREFKSLPFMANSKICRFMRISSYSASEKLKRILTEKIGGKAIRGCRLKPDGQTVPFTGTQVHGYTLEHELGISSNSDKGGDIFGIELKCFTRKKLTLFTPEPDGGLYAESFAQFMTRYGYIKDAVYRFTGLHRAGKVSEKTALTLEVVCIPKNSKSLHAYDPSKPIAHQLDQLRVILKDEEDMIAASWSSDRLLNSWGVKHNEAVYVPASVSENADADDLDNGYSKRVTFGQEVLWCKGTSLEHLIRALASGVIFLDPAPKYDPDNPKSNKRRSQWRINNIYRDSKHLYEATELISITK